MTTERYVNADGVVIDTEVLPDTMRELQVAEVVSVAPVVVQVLSSGRQAQLHKRLASMAAVQVGDLVLVCRVDAGLICVGEVI